MRFNSRKKYKFKNIICILLLFIILLNNNQYDMNKDTSYSQLNIDNNLNPVIRRKGKRILYVSRHEGTFANILYIAEHLGFNVTSLQPNYSYTGRPNCYYKDKCQFFVKSKCSEYDYIIISDVIPDSYIFLINKCKAKIILEITNRFDWVVPDKKKKNYYQTFAKAIKKKNILVVENNPFEVYHACDKNILISSYYLIRPIGYPPNNQIKKEHIEFHDIIAIFKNRNQDKFLANELDKLKIPYKVLPHKYGGPLILATYKAVILMPYQVSIMKTLENLRYGVAMIIPSESLLRNISRKNYTFVSKEVFYISNGVRNYVDFYNDEFKELFIYFDKFKDLKNIVKNKDFENIKQKEIKFMKNYEKKALRMWSEVLDILPEKEFMISDKEPLCKNKKFY